ncbi:MAG: alpha/beta hydrolase [Woeseiaceae bacterium]
MSLRAMLLLAAMSFATASAMAGYHQSSSVPQDDRVFPIGDSGTFDPIPGLTATLKEGVDRDGAVYRYEVPVNWNGDLVMYAHGFRGCFADEATGTLVPLTVDNPPLRAYYLQRGYAWAASSYSKNCYDVKAGVESTNLLARIFKREVAKPNRTLITGFSMGGHVTGAAIEMYPNVKCPDGRRGRFCRRFSRILGRISGGIKYDGAAPLCGVMGDTKLFDYFGDYTFGAEALASEVNPFINSQFPPPEDYATTTLPLTIGTLFSNNGADFPAGLTPQGEQLKNLLRELSGGERPIFEQGFAVYQALLFSFAGSDGSVDGVLGGNGYDNRRRTFQLDNDPGLSSAEAMLNELVLRVRADRGLNKRRFLRLQRVPEITGRISIPVLTMHSLGDLFVPFKMQQIYAEDAARYGRSDLLVQRATRAIGHCEFSPDELVRNFEDLVLWVNEGVKPAGDDVLDPAVVANPAYGCTYTAGSTGQTPDILRTGLCPSE